MALNYVQDYLPEVISVIENHVECSNWSELSNILTQVKGSSGSLGYIELRELILKMEFQVLNKDQDEMVLLLNKLSNIYSRMAAGLDVVNITNDRTAAS